MHFIQIKVGNNENYVSPESLSMALRFPATGYNLQLIVDNAQQPVNSYKLEPTYQLVTSRKVSKATTESLKSAGINIIPGDNNTTWGQRVF